LSVSKRIRLLIVDDVAESRDNVEKLLRFEPDVEVVGKAARGREGVDLTIELKPDVVLMDINMPDMDGITATMEITSRVPGTAVIMMSVQSEPDVLRKAMLAGAREFLSKPFSLDELIEAVRRVSKLARPAVQTAHVVQAATDTATSAPRVAESTIIAIAGNKGGIGRTFVATNLAVALKQLTKREVAIFDTSFHFGDVGVMMNSGESKTIVDAVADAHSLDADLIDDVLFTHSSGVRLLLAPPSPQEAETISSDHVRVVLSILRTMADYVVIDTRPGFDDTTLALLDSSDKIILLLSMEMTSIKDTRQFMEITDLLGYDVERLSLALNRANAYSGIPAREIAENLGREISIQIPEDTQAVLQSINEGAPLLSSLPAHRISSEIRRLASALAMTDIASAAGVVSTNHKPSGLMSRLRTAFR
jgi:pilus assembly protein CpaE